MQILKGKTPAQLTSEEVILAMLSDPEKAQEFEQQQLMAMLATVAVSSILKVGFMAILAVWVSRQCHRRLNCPDMMPDMCLQSRLQC